MSTRRSRRSAPRDVIITPVHRDQIDARRLARALLLLVQAEQRGEPPVPPELKELSRDGD